MKNCIIICIILLTSLLVGCDSAKTDENLSFEDKEEERGISPYCSMVLDYYYAPGQHAYLAKFPDFVSGDSCTQSILLGGWGGFVVLAFDHDVLNNDGKDVIIYCGSSVQPEPGVVYTVLHGVATVTSASSADILILLLSPSVTTGTSTMLIRWVQTSLLLQTVFLTQTLLGRLQSRSTSVSICVSSTTV